MAKDGTNRGGARAGAGAKRKPLADKIAEGNPGRRKLTVIDFQDTADLEGQPMPKPSAMLSATQKDGKTLVAAEVFEKTWTWLAERGCAALVSPQLLERYAMSVARWIQGSHHGSHVQGHQAEYRKRDGLKKRGSRVTDAELFTRLFYYGIAQLGFTPEETMLLPFGLLLDLWECHKQFLGMARPKRELTIDDVIPYGI